MERANFFVHFVGWGVEKTKACSGGIRGLVADFRVDSDLCSLVSFCFLCRDLGVFLILLLWDFLEGLEREPLSEGFWRGWLGCEMERFGGIWRRVLLVFRDFGAENGLAF